MSFEPKRAKGLPPLPKVSQMAILVDAQNYSQLDMYAQIILRELPEDPHANLAASWVARHFDQHFYYEKYFSKAKQGDRPISDLAGDLHIDLHSLKPLEATSMHSTLEEAKANADIKASEELQFHLIKAWGFGFGSEMAALMGHAYLAEILGREPIVHWGENFLYRDSGNECVFKQFFEPFNEFSIHTIKDFDNNEFYPPKWTGDNVLQENQQKNTGQYSKLSSLYFLGRKEAVTIADFYSGVINSKQWISDNHPLQKLGFDETYRYLAKKYLRPRNDIQNLADEFVKTKITAPFLAVHARGSDKDEGYRAMSSIPSQKLNYVQERLAAMPADAKVFLMTDDEALLKKYSDVFGPRLVITDSQRSSSEVGVHYDPKSNKLSAGKEMLMDMLIAAQANYFVGLGLSNPSQLICYFGDFSAENYILFGENRLKQFNTHLYKTVSVR